MIKEDWEKLHKEKRHQTKYPSETVVRFIKTHVEEGAKVLDAGCGAGRHIVFLANEGYKPWGIDFSSNGVLATKDFLSYKNQEKFCSNVIQGEVTDLPYDDAAFDALISYGVLYYLDKEKIRKAFSEMTRVLQTGGWLLLNVRSLNDYRFNRENTLEDDPHGCVVYEHDDRKSAKKENGMRMHFFDKDELNDYLVDFSEVTIDTCRIGHYNDDFFDEDYVVTARKK